MSFDVSHGYLAVRDINALGAPLVPGHWIVHVHDAGWFTLHSGDTVVAAWRANSLGGRGLFAIFSSRETLEGVARSNNEIMPAREAWARRLEPTILAWLRYWPIWRVDCQELDDEGNIVAFTNERRRLVPEGGRLPDPTVDPLPWLLDANGELANQANAVIRVTAIHRPAMLNSMRSEADSFELADIVESTESRQ